MTDEAIVPSVCWELHCRASYSGGSVLVCPIHGERARVAWYVDSHDREALTLHLMARRQRLEGENRRAAPVDEYRDDWG